MGDVAHAAAAHHARNLLVDFAIRWADRHQPEADVLWIGLETVGVSVLAVAQWFGGVLEYRMGMRVSTTEGAGTERG